MSNINKWAEKLVSKYNPGAIGDRIGKIFDSLTTPSPIKSAIGIILYYIWWIFAITVLIVGWINY